MKKNYQKPTMNVVEIHATGIVCTSIDNVNSGEVGITYGGGAGGPARVRQHSGFDWDNEWD